MGQIGAFGRHLLTAAFVLGTASGSEAGTAGPPAYRCFDSTQTTGRGESFTGTCSAESPFAAPLRNGDFTYFHFEDWESYNLNEYVNPIPTTTPGVSVTSAGGGVQLSFSVDQDDNVIDDDGGGGGSGVHAAFGYSVSIVFDAATLGNLPSHAGFVLIGAGNVDRAFSASFYGASDQFLGSIAHAACPGPTNCNTISTDDRFFGWIDAGGIRRITLNSGSVLDTWNFDHLQYGLVPEPSTAALLVAGIAMLARARRARR